MSPFSTPLQHDDCSISRGCTLLPGGRGGNIDLPSTDGKNAKCLCHGKKAAANLQKESSSSYQIGT